MSKLYRLTQSEFLARTHDRERSQNTAQHGISGNPAQTLDTRSTAGISSEAISDAPETSGSSTHAPMARPEDGGVMEWAYLPYPVSVNLAWRMANGRMIINPKATAWKNETRSIMMALGKKPVSGSVSVHYRLHPRKNKDGSAAKTRLDIDNPAKLLLDALNGVAWFDDKQVSYLIAELAEPITGGALSVRIAAMP